MHVLWYGTFLPAQSKRFMMEFKGTDLPDLITSGGMPLLLGAYPFKSVYGIANHFNGRLSIKLVHDLETASSSSMTWREVIL